MVELVVATAPFHIVVINTKLKQNQMQQHWTNYRNPCTNIFLICSIKCCNLRVANEDGAQTIKWIHLNLQTFATIYYPLVIRNKWLVVHFINSQDYNMFIHGQSIILVIPYIVCI